MDRYEGNMSNQSMKKPKAWIEVERCAECVHKYADNFYSTDGFDSMEDWRCEAYIDPETGKGKKIQGAVEWHEEKHIKIPGWCPLLEKKNGIEISKPKPFERSEVITNRKYYFVNRFSEDDVVCNVGDINYIVDAFNKWQMEHNFNDEEAILVLAKIEWGKQTMGEEHQAIFKRMEEFVIARSLKKIDKETKIIGG
jgi:hypothetical protein